MTSLITPNAHSDNTYNKQLVTQKQKSNFPVLKQPAAY